MRENNDHQRTVANLYGSSDLRPPVSHNRGYLLTWSEASKEVKCSKMDTKAIVSFMNSEKAQA